LVAKRLELLRELVTLKVDDAPQHMHNPPMRILAPERLQWSHTATQESHAVARMISRKLLTELLPVLQARRRRRLTATDLR
jgi:hypothetical protein